MIELDFRAAYSTDTIEDLYEKLIEYEKLIKKLEQITDENILS